MKFLRQTLDKVGSHFHSGGKLEKLYPLYEAIDTFLYTPGETTTGSVQVRDAMDLKRVMGTVALALMPCILFACYNTGLQANLAMESIGMLAKNDWRGVILSWLGLGYDPSNILHCFVHGLLYFAPVFLVSNIAGGLCEAAFSIVRKHEINEGFLVTGLLYPLTLPATIPLWQAAVGIIFAVIIGKEVFGGTGKNFLNPALTGRAFLYFAYPAQISGDAVWTAVDGFSGATALSLGATGGIEAITQGMTWLQSFYGLIQGSMGETSVIACLFGAIVLIATGVGSWRIMISCVAGAVGFSALLYALGSDSNVMFSIPPHWHLVIGGFAFGTVFMATDPVSAPMNIASKWAYGLLIGFMTILIRAINPAFPEGIMLAILFANVFAPLIDYVVINSNVKFRQRRQKLLWQNNTSSSKRSEA